MPENCRKNAGKKTEISKNGNGRIRFSNFRFFPFFLNFRFFSGIFPAIFRFSKTQSVFCYLIFFKKTDKNRKKNGNFKKRKWTDPFFSVSLRFFFRFFSVFFPAFFKKSGKMPEKMGLFFSGNLRFVSVFGSKTELKPDKIRKIPMRIKTGTATCGFFKKNCVFLGKKMKKRKKNGLRF